VKAHIIEGGVVVNTIEVDSFDFMPNLVDATEGGIGWTYDGTNFTDPSALTETELDERKVSNNRANRNYLLAKSDWWASSDLTMTDEQTAYRQALRDITSHSNWPDLNEADWPTKPS